MRDEVFLIDSYNFIFEIIRNFPGREDIKGSTTASWKKIGDINTLQTFLEDLSTDTLRHLYKELWNNSQRSFCRSYSISQGNFSQWINGKRNSPICERTVIKFLIELPALFPDLDITAKSTRQLCSTKIKESSRDKTCQFKDFHSPKSALRILISKIKENNIETLLLIDGDHSTRVLRQLAYIEPSSKFSSQWPIHAVMILQKDVYPSMVFSYTNRAWLTVIKTNTQCKNAADIVLTSISNQITTYCILKSKLKPHIILVSSDNFTVELQPILQDLDFSVDRISPKFHLGVWLLSRKHLHQLVSSEDNVKLKQINDAKDVIHNAIVKISSIGPKTLKQFICHFKELVTHSCKIMGINTHQAALVLARDYIWSNSKKYLGVSEVLEEDLRSEFKICYKSTSQEFCREFDIEERTFDLWLNKYNPPTKKIVDSIQKWIDQR